MRARVMVAAATLLAAASTAALSAQATAAPTQPPDRGGGQAASDSGPAVHHDVSPPLSDIALRTEAGRPKKARPDKRDSGMPPPAEVSRTDPVVQTSRSSATPATASSVDGVGNGFGGPAGSFTVTSAPPDTNAAVGSTQVVEVVNSSFAVFDKSGAILYGPAATNTLWSGFGGFCQSTDDGDGVVRWDTMAGRWIMAQFANASSNTGPYDECVAVSQTADATGAWYRYAFQYSNFPDYPKIGVWPDAYYATFNMFATNGAYVGPEACAYNRAAMLSGGAASQQCFTASSAYGSLLPSDLDGATPPPSGRPDVLVGLGTTNAALAYWTFHVDWSNPANSVLSGPGTISVGAFNEACSGGTCIPQGGTTTKLDSLGDRLMYRLAYRNFGSYESLVASQSVAAGTSTGVRWYELRIGSSGAPTLYQQSTYAPDSKYRWMPSAAEDGAGDIALGFSVSSSSTHPGIAFSGRLAGGPLGQMTQGEATAITGGGSQTGTLTRWGDYSSMAVDPVDDCTFWYANEYIPANGTFNWSTRLTSFKLGTCGSSGQSDFAMAVSPTSGTVTSGSGATATVSTTVSGSGTPQTVALSASGLPAGATASFSPSSVTAGSPSTMTIATTSSTPGGTYAVTVTGTGGASTHSAGYTLTVNAPAGSGGVTNGGFESGNLSGWTSSGAATGVTTTAHSGSYAAVLGSTAPTNGDSSIAQTFTVPTGDGTLGFWYQVTCPDSVSYDWATATLKDNTAGTTSTPLPHTCTNNGAGPGCLAAHPQLHVAGRRSPR